MHRNGIGGAGLPQALHGTSGGRAGAAGRGGEAAAKGGSAGARSRRPAGGGGLAALGGLLRAAADKTRLRILHLLLGGELCVGDIEAVLGLPQSTVSRHLACLRRSGLVVARPAGRWAFYGLAGPRGPLHEGLLRYLASSFAGLRELQPDARRLDDVRAISGCCEGAPTDVPAAPPRSAGAGGRCNAGAGAARRARTAVGRPR